MNNSSLRHALAAGALPLFKGFGRHLRVPLYVNAYYLMGTSAVRALSGLPFWAIAARLHTPADVGIASALVSAVMLLASVSSLGLDSGLVRFLPHTGRDMNDVLNSSFTLLTLTSILAALTFMVALPLWSPSLTQVCYQASFMISFVFFTVAGTLSSVVDQVFVAHRSARFTFYKNVISNTLKIPLPVLLVAFSAGTGIFFSVWSPVLLALLVSLLWFVPRLQQGYLPRLVLRRRLLGDLMRYSLTNYAANLLVALPATLFPLMVVSLLHAESNAYFAAAWTMSQPLFMISVATSSSMFAEGSFDDRSLSRLQGAALRLSFLILGIAVMVVFVTGDKLLLIFGQPYSQNGTTLLRLLSLCAFPVAVKLIGLTVFRVTKHLTQVVAVSAVDACFSLALGYFLVRSLGLNGLGLGLLLGQTTAAIVCTALPRHDQQAGEGHPSA